MTSATSSVKGPGRRPRTARRFFGWSLRGNLLIACVGAVLALLITPGVPLLSYFYERSLGIAPASTDTMDALLPGVSVALGVLAGLLSLILSGLNYRYMHSKAASDVFHALPLTRRQLLLSRFFSTYLMTLFPVVLAFLGTAVAVAVTPLSGLTPTLFVSYLLTLAILLFTCCAFTALLAVSTGSGFDMFAALFISNIGWPVIWILLASVCQYEIIGFPSTFLLDHAGLVFLLSPFGRLSGVEFWSGGPAADWVAGGSALRRTMAGCLVLGLAFLIAALLLYKRRKSEKAGAPYAFSYLPLVLQVLASAIGGSLIGALFSFGNLHSFVFYIFMAVGAVLGAIIPGAVFARGFKRIRRDLVTAGCVFLVLVSVAGVIFSGGLGYETRLPNLSAVRQVDWAMYGGAPYAYPDYETEAWDVAAADQSVIFTEEADIRAAYALHGAIVQWVREHPGTDEQNASIGGAPTEEADATTHVRFTYHTKWGTQISRQYYIRCGAFKAWLAPILSSAAYRQTSEDVYKMGKIEDYTTLSCWDALTQSTITEPVAADKASRLIEAYQSDLSIPLTEDTLLQRERYTLTLFNYEGEGDRSPITLTVYEQYQNTLSVLKEMGYADRLQNAASAKGNGQLPTVYIPAESAALLADFEGEGGYALLGYLYSQKAAVIFDQNSDRALQLSRTCVETWSYEEIIQSGAPAALLADGQGHHLFMNAAPPEGAVPAPLTEEQYQICLYYMAYDLYDYMVDGSMDSMN